MKEKKLPGVDFPEMTALPPYQMMMATAMPPTRSMTGEERARILVRFSTILKRLSFSSRNFLYS